jgi:hypothetical protein
LGCDRAYVRSQPNFRYFPLGNGRAKINLPTDDGLKTFLRWLKTCLRYLITLNPYNEIRFDCLNRQSNRLTDFYIMIGFTQFAKRSQEQGCVWITPFFFGILLSTAPCINKRTFAPVLPGKNECLSSNIYAAHSNCVVPGDKLSTEGGATRRRPPNAKDASAICRWAAMQ